jgi:hypothetical protein
MVTNCSTYSVQQTRGRKDTAAAFVEDNSRCYLQVAALTAADSKRLTPVKERLAAQQGVLKLPILPTTTIGSFPQTPEIRRVRRELKSGK